MRAINIDDFCRGESCAKPYCMDDPNCGGMICEELNDFLYPFKQDEVIEVIPMSYIMDRIRDTCGAESAYLSKLIRRYKEEQKSNALS